MPPNKRARVSKRAANSGKQRKLLSKASCLVCCVIMSDDHCLDYTDKDDDGETASPAKEKTGSKSKAAAKKKASSEPAGPPQYRHWLMKSEPESRFENGIDVKVQSSDAPVSTVCCSCERAALF